MYLTVWPIDYQHWLISDFTSTSKRRQTKTDSLSGPYDLRAEVINHDKCPALADLLVTSEQTFNHSTRQTSWQLRYWRHVNKAPAVYKPLKQSMNGQQKRYCRLTTDHICPQVTGVYVYVCVCSQWTGLRCQPQNSENANVAASLKRCCHLYLLLSILLLNFLWLLYTDLLNHKPLYST